MKTFLLFAFVSFVLAVSQAIPVREQDIQAKEDELKDVVNDFKLDNTERYDELTKVINGLKMKTVTFTHCIKKKDSNSSVGIATLLTHFCLHVCIILSGDRRQRSKCNHVGQYDHPEKTCFYGVTYRGAQDSNPLPSKFPYSPHFYCRA